MEALWATAGASQDQLEPRQADMTPGWPTKACRERGRGACTRRGSSWGSFEASQACLRVFVEDLDADSKIRRAVLGVEAGILPCQPTHRKTVESCMVFNHDSGGQTLAKRLHSSREGEAMVFRRLVFRSRQPRVSPETVEAVASRSGGGLEEVKGPTWKPWSLPGLVGAQTSRYGPEVAPQSLPAGVLVPSEGPSWISCEVSQASGVGIQTTFIPILPTKSFPNIVTAIASRSGGGLGEVKGPTWQPCGVQQEPLRASRNPDKPIWPRDGPTKLAGGDVCTRGGPSCGSFEISQACLLGLAEVLEADSRIGRAVLGVEAGILL